MTEQETTKAIAAIRAAINRGEKPQFKNQVGARRTYSIAGYKVDISYGNRTGWGRAYLVGAAPYHEEEFFMEGEKFKALAG